MKLQSQVRNTCNCLLHGNFAVAILQATENKCTTRAPEHPNRAPEQPGGKSNRPRNKPQTVKDTERKPPEESPPSGKLAINCF